ncbi:LPXTG cell wall anchor domain-containing protein [Neobacillus drentensis]
MNKWKKTIAGAVLIGAGFGLLFRKRKGGKAA